MPKKPSFDLLIDVTNEAVDEAAKVLQKAASERDKAQQQLDMLHDYRLDYAQRLLQSTEVGVTASNYLNFRRFLNTLDEAIVQQNNIVAHSESQLTAGRQQWQAEKQRLGAYEALQSRQRQQQVLRNARREQRANDEIAANLFRRDNGKH
ncbi:MAG: flagellar export protein FliJ [Alcaligenaceae bacterium]|nr:flagellar export protein FliJ [Alcaligenaceae bacterium]